MYEMYVLENRTLLRSTRQKYVRAADEEMSMCSSQPYSSRPNYDIAAVDDEVEDYNNAVDICSSTTTRHAALIYGNHGCNSHRFFTDAEIANAFPTEGS